MPSVIDAVGITFLDMVVTDAITRYTKLQRILANGALS